MSVCLYLFFFFFHMVIMVGTVVSVFCMMVFSHSCQGGNQCHCALCEFFCSHGY